jgi:hypothetical protein
MSPTSLRPASPSPCDIQLSRSRVILVLAIVLATSLPLWARQPLLGLLALPWVQHITVSATLSPGTVGLPYSAVISVSGGTAPYTFKQKNLPLGLVLDPRTGAILGVPQSAGSFPFDVWVGDKTGIHGLGQFTLTVGPPVGITISPASATVGSAATGQFQAAVTNTSNSSVAWWASLGSVSTSGLFTAPTVKANSAAVVTATSDADPTKSAAASVTILAPVIKVSLQVLFPPTNPNTPDFRRTQTYLMSNPIVSGANFSLQWGMIDHGPAASPQYDWSAMDAAIAPWAAAGKKVNLIVWANSDSTAPTCSDGSANTTGNCAIPSYIWTALGPANYTTCATQYGTQRMPNYFDRAGFQTPYQQFMAAVIQKYGTSTQIGYIRFGLGHGGETFPVTGWNHITTPCGKAFATWGVTVTTWESYLSGMLAYLSNLHSGKQLMIGLNPMGVPNTLVPDFVAPIAVPMNVAFGSQGLEQSDITSYPVCTANWCNLFEQYHGQVPLELQTVLLSCPDKTCATGSLVDLVPFAVSHHVTVLEIYYMDWLLAFDPSSPGYSKYGPAYAQVLTQAAKTPIQ